MTAALESPTSRLVRLGYPLLGLSVFAVYLPTLSRGVTFSDGPELCTAVTTLGVAHPTGYPIFTMLAHAFQRLLVLPVAPCTKIEVFNALCGAGVAMLMALVTRETAVRAAPAESADDADLAGLVAGAFVGTAPLLWSQVRLPEVYAFHALLVSWALYLWMRFERTGRDGYVIAAALPMGIGLAHHVTMVYMMPAALVYLAVRKPSFFTTRAFLIACVVGFLPLLSYGYLLWADAHTTGVSWGGVHDLPTLYAHFTGKQYQRYMGKLVPFALWSRLRVAPEVFDAQFFAVGTALFLPGLVTMVRRAWRPTLFLMTFLAFNVGHAIHYAVGDFSNYYIPAVLACAPPIGVGLAMLLGWARSVPAPARVPTAFAVCAAMFGGAALIVLGYARARGRLPAPLAQHAIPWLVAPLAVLAVIALAGAVATRSSRARPGAALVPALLLTGVFLPLVAVDAVRARDFAREPVIGEGYGADVAATVKPGALLMTGGDGFLFTLWYEAHVADRGRDIGVIDVYNVHKPWFRDYLSRRFPIDCDPLDPRFASDPAAFASRCGTEEKKKALGATEPWFALGSVTIGAPPPVPPFHVVPPATLPRRGVDRECADPAFREEHADRECGCWAYAHGEGPLGDACVFSVEEGVVVSRDRVEVTVQRLIEDQIDERPIFERNVLTGWDLNYIKNPIGWDGPSEQRISADYALLNRGRVNQIVHAEDVAGFDPCASTQLHALGTRLRPLVPPGSYGKGAERRRPYRPSDVPTLIAAAWLLSSAEATEEDDATRTFAAGDPVLLHVDWFERFHFAWSVPLHHGKPIRYGIRACVFDPDGQRVAVEPAVSGTGSTLSLLPRGAASKPGRYVVQACSVGELEGGPDAAPRPFMRPALEPTLTVPEGRACDRTLLEMPFDVVP